MMFWGCGGNWGWGWGMGLGWLFMILFWGLVLFGAVSLFRVLSGGRRPGRSALEILQQRYARGEISRDEYEQMRRDLQN